LKKSLSLVSHTETDTENNSIHYVNDNQIDPEKARELSEIFLK